MNEQYLGKKFVVVMENVDGYALSWWSTTEQRTLYFEQGDVIEFDAGDTCDVGSLLALRAIEPYVEPEPAEGGE